VTRRRVSDWGAPARALELAERALAAVRDGDEALAGVTRERSLFLRFAASRPTQATSVDDVTIELATVEDGHVGRAATNRSDAEALSALARRAAEAAVGARAAAGPGTYPGFSSPGPAPAHAGHDPATAQLDSAVGGAALAGAFAAAGRAGVEAHGAWTAAEVEAAVATSAGGAVEERVTDAFMKVVCIDPDTRRSGYAAATATAVGGIDPDTLAERAARKAVSAGEPATLPSGEYPLVLEPHAVGLLLELLGYTAFDGLAHAEERGALVGRLGTRVTAPAINLSDSPRFPTTLPRAFDAEGVAKAPLPLIQDGVAHAVVHDTRSAALAGARSTGHALVPGGGRGPLPTNLVLIGGGAADEEELCAPIERGVYVTRLWYANVVRPRETLVTAVTRDGSFLIEDGRPTRPLANMRLTDSVLGLLSRVQALASRPKLTSEGEFYGRRFATGTVCPALRTTGRMTSARS
jgi:predicted Zn-dependent protease